MATGQYFGEHVDNSIRGDHLTGMRIRTDLSVDAFSVGAGRIRRRRADHRGPLRYAGVKLPAGISCSTRHEPALVHRVTRGVRTASFFWLQSMIRDAQARSLIFDLDNAIQELVERLGRNDPEVRRADQYLSQSHPLLGRAMNDVGLETLRPPMPPWRSLLAASPRPRRAAGRGRAAAAGPASAGSLSPRQSRSPRQTRHFTIIPDVRCEECTRRARHAAA